MKLSNLLGPLSGFAGLMLALFAVPPGELIANVADYGDTFRAYAYYLLYPVAILIPILLIYTGRTLYLTLKRAFDQHVQALLDAKIEEAFLKSAADDLPLVELLERRPEDIKALALRLGIGSATDGGNSVAVRLDKIDARLDHYIGQSEETNRLVNAHMVNRLEVTAEFRRMMSLHQRHLRVTMEYPSLKFELSQIWERWDWASKSWREWEVARGAWYSHYRRWSQVFPYDARFGQVLNVLKVSPSEMRDAVRQVRNTALLTPEQQHEYQLFAAQREKFLSQSVLAMEGLRDMAQVRV